MQQTTLTVTLFLAGAAAGIPLGLALSQAAPQVHVEIKLQRGVSEIPQPVDLHVRDDRWDPGAETGAHDHPGPTILAIIEGELVEETSAGRNTLRAGQVLWRAARQTHNVKNVSGKPARVLAIHYDPGQ